MFNPDVWVVKAKAVRFFLEDRELLVPRMCRLAWVWRDSGERRCEVLLASGSCDDGTLCFYFGLHSGSFFWPTVFSEKSWGQLAPIMTVQTGRSPWSFTFSLYSLVYLQLASHNISVIGYMQNPQIRIQIKIPQTRKDSSNISSNIKRGRYPMTSDPVTAQPWLLDAAGAGCAEGIQLPEHEVGPPGRELGDGPRRGCRGEHAI